MEYILPDLEFAPEIFVDRSALLLGASGSGKSVTIIDILFTIKDYVDQIIVISPTDKQNHTYDCGVIPRPCIHYDLTEELLKNIWDRQAALVDAYTRMNNIDIFKSLFDRCSDQKSCELLLTAARLLRDTKAEIIATNESGPANEKCKAVVIKYDVFREKVYKKCIESNSAQLKKMNLNTDEKFTLKYMHMNPRIVLIFDDCTELLDKFKTNSYLKKLFFQGRHSFITILIASHTDKAISPEIKKNIFATLFTEPTSFHAYVNRGSNDYDRDGKKKALNAEKVAFTPTQPHQKLAYIRDQGKYYKFTANRQYDFKFGSDIFWEYCNRIVGDGRAMSVNNKFAGEFRV